MPDITIKGVKLLKAKKKHPEKVSAFYVVTEQTENGPSHRKRDEECDAPPHPDLKNGLNGLAVHLALLTDCVPEKMAKNKEALEPFHVTGYSLSGDDNDAVIISGYRLTKRGGAAILNSPLFRMEDDSDYLLLGHLTSQIETCNQEVLLYLTEGKRAPEAQAVLDFDNDGKEDE